MADFTSIQDEDNDQYLQAVMRLSDALDSKPKIPPTPVRSELPLDVRSKIRTSHKIASWPLRKISKELGVPLSTVYGICRHPFTPPHVRPGRPKMIPIGGSIQMWLIQHATSSQENRRKPLMQIAEEEGIEFHEQTLQKAFADAGYHRRIARVKPYLSLAAKAKHLTWANNIRDFTIVDFQKIVCTDECAFNVGGFAGNTWVTRLPEEEYNEDCLVPRFRKLETIMVWGCIYGSTKGALVFWDKKNWGKTLTGPGYCEHIVRANLYPFWQQRAQAVLDYVYIMHDGASPHRAKYTTNVLRELGILGYIFDWPGSSPDCNPIENIWRLMKDRIGRRIPRCTSNTTLQAVIQEEWDAITSDEIRTLVNSMPERIQAVLSANGGHTKY